MFCKRLNGKCKSFVTVTMFMFLSAISSETIAAAVLSTNTADNLLTNPSFNIGESVPEGWEFRSWNNTSQNAHWGLEKSGRTGPCVTICSTNDKGADAAWTARVTVRPNTFYILSGWIKTRNVRGATGALLNIQNMQLVKTQAIKGTSDWTFVSTIFRSEEMPTELEINCLFGGWGESTGQAWYDDISLNPATYSEQPSAVVTVEKGAKTKPYSPLIFGGFLEHFGKQIYGGVFEPESPLSDENGFRKDVIAALKELKVPIIRWPGGCFASGYHWYYGVGQQRKPTDDMAWGVIESNRFGTDEFVKLCRLLECTPYICTNAGNGTVDEMRDWVEYCNGRQGRLAVMRKENGNNKPHNVPIWSIGNENWGQHEIGYKPIEQWAPLVRQAAEAMKAADPNIQLTAAALPTREWTLPLLEQAGDYLDYISIHLYSLGLWQKNDMPDYMTCIMKSQDAERLIVNYISVLEESGYRGRIKIALDEWNLRGWHHQGFPRKTVQDYNDPEIIQLVTAREKNLIASQYTMADALYSASVFNSCMRYCDDVGMANIAPLMNTRGPLFVHPKGIVKRSTFHTIAMYTNLLESRVATSVVNSEALVHNNQSIPVLDAIVTTDQSGNNWSIALVNRHPSQEVECTIKINDIPLNGRYDATILTGDTITSYNDIEHPNSVSPKKTQIEFTKGVGKLPPHCLTILQVTLK